MAERSDLAARGLSFMKRQLAKITSGRRMCVLIVASTRQGAVEQANTGRPLGKTVEGVGRSCKVSEGGLGNNRSGAASGTSEGGGWQVGSESGEGGGIREVQLLQDCRMGAELWLSQRQLQRSVLTAPGSLVATSSRSSRLWDVLHTTSVSGLVVRVTFSHIQGSAVVVRRATTKRLRGGSMFDFGGAQE